jgi:hypothetical protein
MTAESPERLSFECKAKDGLIVRLTATRYTEHILEDHPELEFHFQSPPSQIRMALECAEEILQGNKPDTRIYIGPSVRPDGPSVGFGGPPKPRRFRVVVCVESGYSGFVTTAYAPTAVVGKSR